MSIIESLRINQVRNIAQLELDCHPQFTLIHGENGSGKTSILEAIHLLANGRSFRTSATESLINNDANEAVVFAQLAGGHRVGISRSRNDKKQLRLDESVQSNWDDVARLLPVLVLDASAFLLLEGGPRARRQFMDWGVFHVEPTFLTAWRRFRKSLANRNHLLKQPRPAFDQIQVWDKELITAAELVDQCRDQYLAALLPVFRSVYSDIAGERAMDLSITYYRGWDAEKSLAEVFVQSRDMDCKYRATQFGPQRADVTIKTGKHKALEVLSRGQQKLLVSALKIAQGQLLADSNGRHSVYLVDDLPAELDQGNRESVLATLAGLKSQLFVTCVDKDSFNSGQQKATEMASFHVERGKINT